MSTLFEPDSIAVVGASADPTRIAGRPIDYLQRHGFDGAIYPVNPAHDEVAGLPCYPDVGSVPEPPEFAMVILPARLVEEAVAECVEAGVDTVLVVSSGFAETGDEEGADAEARLAALVADTDTTLVGPNSQGMINVPGRIAASFTPALARDELRAGPVSFVTQSGAFGGALTTMLQEAGVGLNRWLSTGNEAALESLDVLADFATDDSTEIAAGYFEGVEDGRTLIELKRREAGIDLPIVALKAARSTRGKAAAASHTGKITGDHTVYEGVFGETGVIGVDDVDRFVDVVAALTRLDTLPGPRIGVVTTSGGAGSHIADVVAAERGIELPALSDGVRERLDEHVPSYGSTANPVDVTAQVVSDQDSFAQCLGLLLDADEFDAVVLQITNATGDRAVDYATLVTETATDSDTPVFVSWTGGIEKDAGLAVYEDAGIPVFENPARCIRSVAAIARFAAAREPLRAAQSLPARPPTHDGGDAPAMLAEHEATDLLADHGVTVPESRLASSADEAVAAAEAIGFPVVAKLVSPEIPHRDRIGGVRLGLENADAVAAAYDEILAAGEDHEVTGVSIQAQVEDGLELGLGIVTDTDFGPVVVLARGGTDIETADDATVRTIPLAREQAATMLADLETVDVEELTDAGRDAVVDALVALSAVYCENPWIIEADVNPLIVGEAEAVAVDALFVGAD